MKILQRSILLIFIFCFILFLFPGSGHSVNFSISPIRVFFDHLHKTNALTINNQASEKVNLQLRAFKWDQDENGESVYSPSKDLIFFPKLLTIQKNEDRIIRIGTKTSRGEKEKTYRLFIEEIPFEGPDDSTAVKIIMKVGVPVFIMPVKTMAKGIIEKAEMNNSNLSIMVKNDGNVHFIIRAVKVTGYDASGSEIYAEEMGGRYLHAGNSKSFAFEIPEERCREMNTVDINIDTDRLSIGKKLGILQDMCKL